VRGFPRIHFICGVAAALIVGGAMLPPAPAEAQGLFDFFNQMFRGFRPQRPEAPRPASSPGGYCVRLCDGRYFPVPPSAGTESTPALLCNALCPAAATRVYSGGGIDKATAASGEPYTKLDTAFLYRERLVEGCTCNGDEAGGTAALDFQYDPTLKPGDVVVTKAGPRVFNGGEDGPRGAEDFVTPDKARGLSAADRRALAAIRVLPAEENAAPPRAEAPRTDNVSALGDGAPVPRPRPHEPQADKGGWRALFRFSEVYAPYPP